MFSSPDLYSPTSFGVSTCELPPPKMLPFNVFCNIVNRKRLSLTSTSIIEPMPVTTQVPVLAVRISASSMYSPLHLADGDDDLVGHHAVGDVDDRRDGLGHRRVDVRGAELDRLLALPLVRVDRDDVLGAGDDGALQRAHADAADADDHHGLAGLDLGDVGGRAETGRHRAAHDGGGLERDVFVDLDDGVLVHRHVRGEGAEQVHRRYLGGAGMHPAGAVGDGLAAEQHGAAVTQRTVALQARRTGTAGGDERQDDVVALGDAA